MRLFLIIDTLGGESYHYCNRLIYTDATQCAAVRADYQEYAPVTESIANQAGGRFTVLPWAGIQERAGVPGPRPDAVRSSGQ